MAKATKPPSIPVKFKRRRVKLDTLEATARESARTYRDLVQSCGGVTTLAKAQARSKVLVNHNGILNRAAEQSKLDELLAQLKKLNGEDDET